MARESSPTLRRRQLGTRFRELRQNAGMTVEDVANRLMVSVAKVSRIETGARGISPRDVRDLCDIYQVDSDERERLMDLARQSREHSWWQDYDLPFATFVGLEAAAASISVYESSLVPSLLQTEDYARALVQGMRPDLDRDAMQQRVEARLTRQLLLTAEGPPRYWAAIDEAALRRIVGGKAVMRRQLEEMTERAVAPSVTLVLVPFKAGAHPGMNSAFTLLHFEEAVSDVVYVESLAGYLYLQHSHDLDRYQQVINRLAEVGLSPKQSLARIRAIARSYKE